MEARLAASGVALAVPPPIEAAPDPTRSRHAGAVVKHAANLAQRVPRWSDPVQGREGAAPGC